MKGLNSLRKREALVPHKQLFPVTDECYDWFIVFVMNLIPHLAYHEINLNWFSQAVWISKAGCYWGVLLLLRVSSIIWNTLNMIKSDYICKSSKLSCILSIKVMQNTSGFGEEQLVTGFWWKADYSLVSCWSEVTRGLPVWLCWLDTHTHTVSYTGKYHLMLECSVSVHESQHSKQAH